MKTEWRLFDQIQIETKFACNKKCPMCPNSKYPPDGSEMTHSLYKKILGELKELDFKGRITLYLRNEPFLDKRIFNWIYEAREMFPDNRINTSTNTEILTEEMLHNAFILGLTDLDMSCYTKEAEDKWGGYHDGVKINVHRFAPEHFDMNWFNNRGGYVGFGCNKVGEGICYRPSIQMYVTSKGKCVLCCNDFLEDVVLGDLNEQTIWEVWDSPLYNEYREKLYSHEAWRKTLKLCKDCNYTGW